MVHLRIVVPSHQSEHTLDLLKASPSVSNLIFLRGAAQRPAGDVILCDVAREDASVIVGDLKELEIDKEGSIAMEEVASEISAAGRKAEAAASGAVEDAVVWEEVEARTSEHVELSAGYVIFMCLAMLIASVGIFLDQIILIIGAMVVSPEFGPIAGLCVAAVQKRADLLRRSARALTVGFLLGILSAFLFSLFSDAVGLVPDDFDPNAHPFTKFISEPGTFSFIVAFFAGIAGMLSLTSAKSGALVGVAISVTTIPAAANIGVGLAFADRDAWAGALLQLSLNLTAIILAGLGTLYLQRLLYVRRRRAHLRDEVRDVAGLPVGRSRRSSAATSGKK